MKNLPKAIYAVIKDDGDEPYLLAGSSMVELGIDVGDKVKIGLYKLDGFYEAEGVIQTGHLVKR